MPNQAQNAPQPPTASPDRSAQNAPFGTLAPDAAQEKFRNLAHQLPTNYWGRRFASLLLGPAGGREKTPRDVTVFGDQKARLYPYDNICEKRVYATPQLWDGQERAMLAQTIKDHGQAAFYFVDVGANAGLYTLFARSSAIAAGKPFKAACIEPDGPMRARLLFNLQASKAENDVRVFSYAAAAARGSLKFTQSPKSRGMGHIDDHGDVTVQGAPLDAIIRSETEFPRIDALKIDIEGHEAPVFESFFNTAPEDFHPGLIIMETSHDRTALSLCEAAGYKIRLQTKMNAVLAKG